jgi:hypothetical protein
MVFVADVTASTEPLAYIIGDKNTIDDTKKKNLTKYILI